MIQMSCAYKTYKCNSKAFKEKKTNHDEQN